MTKTILKTEGPTKHYGGVHELEDANFELRDGEHVAVVGDNGAGKVHLRAPDHRGRAAHPRPGLVRR
jgi:ABC-type sugar transport system ATPase subunit